MLVLKVYKFNFYVSPNKYNLINDFIFCLQIISKSKLPKFVFPSFSSIENIECILHKVNDII